MVRVWRRRLLGGMGMATIVPGLLLASLVVLGFAGGFAGLSALGQALSGPSVPASAVGGGRGGPVSRALPLRLVAALSSASGAAHAGSGAVVATAGPGSAPRASGPPVSSGPRAGGPPPAQSPRRNSHVTGPGPQPTPQPTVVDKVVSAGTSVTSQLPGPVGPAATNALQSAGSTLDSIAPIKSP